MRRYKNSKLNQNTKTKIKQTKQKKFQKRQIQKPKTKNQYTIYKIIVGDIDHIGNIYPDVQTIEEDSPTNLNVNSYNNVDTVNHPLTQQSHENLPDAKRHMRFKKFKVGDNILLIHQIRSLTGGGNHIS
jgi:hypothetical protein